MTGFINPYTFVPFESTPNRKKQHSRPVPPNELKTGWMDVRIEVKTPLIIPGKELSNIDGHITKDFFRLPDGTYAIPGSSLRGMVRSVYEAASNSCVPFVLDSKEMITSRTPVSAAFKERGLLEYDKETECWSLHSTVVYRNPVKKNKLNTVLKNVEYHFSENQQKGDFVLKEGVYQNAHKIPFNANGEDLEGWLQFQKPVALKDDAEYHVCALVKDELLCTWEKQFDGRTNNQPYIDLKTELDYTIKNSKAKNNAHVSLRDALEEAKNSGGVVPVWYLKITHGDESDYYLSPSAIGRIHQRRSWREIMGDYAPCTDPNNLCPACQLFGVVSERMTRKINNDVTQGEKEGCEFDRQSDGRDMKIRGKLRFGDAIPEDGQKIEEKLIEAHLQILENPKVSAFEFYLKSPDQNAQYWNFDYYAVKDGDYWKYNYLEEAMSRGRKMYWHSQNQRTIKKPNNYEKGNNKLNGSFKAVSTGTFVFRLFYDRVTDEQLKGLRWALTLGEGANECRHQHKLGHGKPLGYGSVKLSIMSEAERKVRYSEGRLHYTAPIVNNKAASWKPECPFDEKSLSLSALLAITDVGKTRGKIVSYPLEKQNNSDEIKIFSWFSKNRNNSPKVLPNPTNSSIELQSTLDASDFEKDILVPENQRLELLKNNDPNHLIFFTNGCLKGKQIARVKNFNKNGSAYLVMSATNENGFMARKGKPWSDQLRAGDEGDVIEVIVDSYDKKYGQYQVKYSRTIES